MPLFSMRIKKWSDAMGQKIKFSYEKVQNKQRNSI